MVILGLFSIDPIAAKTILEWGLPLALTGMAIVFFSLTLISIYIGTLPKVLAILDPYLPKHTHEEKAPPSVKSFNKNVIAAIGYTLHHHKNNDN